jgi:hypothetical protein
LPRRTPAKVSEPITAAFAGSGTVKAETLFELLSDFFEFGPEDEDGVPADTPVEVRFLLPITLNHLTDVVYDTIDWLNYVNYPYEAVTNDGGVDASVDALANDAEERHFQDDINLGLVQLLATAESPRKVLILAYDTEDPSEEDEKLLELALENNVKVLNLTEALDHITGFEEPADDSPPAFEPMDEIVSEPVKPRGRAAKAAPKEAVPVEVEALVEPEPVADETVSAVAEAIHKSIEAEIGVNYGPTSSQTTALGWAVERVRDLTSEMEILLAYIAEQTGREFNAEPSSPQTLPPTPTATRGKPRGGPSPAEGVSDETVPYYSYGDGTYKKVGRGRPQKDVAVVRLTEAEISALNDQDLIEG